MPRVSVIMGIYNTNNEVIVNQSIISILSQTYSNFEFIICDDGSNDGTFELIKNLTIHDKRVVIIRNETNEGLAKTLNKCLEIAKGEYIARMDADDISMLTRLEKQVDFLDSNPQFDLVGSNAVLFDENGDWGTRTTIESPVKKSFLFGTPFIHPTILIRTKTLRCLGGYRTGKETLRCEDYDLFMRLYAVKKSGYNLSENLLKFRENKEAYKRRKFKYRWDEAKVRYKGFKILGLFPLGIIFTLKPLIIGMIPQNILAVLRNENNH